MEVRQVRTDEELMLDLRRGQRHSLDELFARYHAPVWRFFRRRVSDSAVVDELTQDVFAALLTSAATYEVRGLFRSYLFAIAYRTLLASRRRSPFEVEGGPPDDIAGAPADPDAVIWVRQALAQLEPGEREILMLREYEQLSYQELADVRGIPVNPVRSQLFRARAALRDLLTGAAVPKVER